MAKLIIAAVAIFAVSAASLVCSYLVFTSQAWKVAFGWMLRELPKPGEDFHEPLNLGWLVELGRSLIDVIAAVVLLGVVLRTEATEFFGLTRVVGWRREWLVLCRIIALALLVFAVVFLIKHHVHDGPNDLANPERSKWAAPNTPWNQAYRRAPKLRTNPKFFRFYVLPYLCYLPYTFIIYAVIGIPLATVSLYAAVVDLRCIGEMTGNIPCREPEGLDSTTDTCKEIVARFNEFCLALMKILDRHAAMLSLLALAVTFEYWWGQYTLSERAFVWVAISFVLVGIGLLIVVATLPSYTTGYNRVCECLLKLRCAEQEIFEKENGVPKFFRRVFNHSVLLYFTFLVLLLNSPLRELTKTLGELTKILKKLTGE